MRFLPVDDVFKLLIDKKSIKGRHTEVEWLAVLRFKKHDTPT